MIKTLIVDGNEDFRSSLKLLLSLDDEIIVAGDVGTRKETIDFIKNEFVDVILLNLDDMGVGDHRTLKRIREINGYVRIIFLTNFEYKGNDYDEMKYRIFGSIRKDSTGKDYCKIIKNAVKH